MLEDRLKQELDIREEEKRAEATRKTSLENDQKQREKEFYPFVKEAVEEFPKLAKKYNTKTSLIQLHKKSLFGGEPRFKDIVVWNMPYGCIDINGNYYSEDKLLRYGPFNSNAALVYKRITKEEVIELNCKAYSRQMIAEFSDPEKGAEAMKKYVEDQFLSKLIER